MMAIVKGREVNTFDAAQLTHFKISERIPS